MDTYKERITQSMNTREQNQVGSQRISPPREEREHLDMRPEFKWILKGLKEKVHYIYGHRTVFLAEADEDFICWKYFDNFICTLQ